MTRYCCQACFDDRGLRKNIIPSMEPDRGTCDYCKATDVDLVEPVELIDYFQLLASIYELDPVGRPLVDWMKEDWQLFPNLDSAHAKELLADILEDGEIVRKTFSPSATYRSEALVGWESLRDELMYKNRYFLDKVIDTDRLQELLDHLIADELPSKWYRARIRTGDEDFLIGQMGAPPRRLATPGRANPPGIPYLYLGSLPETAIAEVRPHTGEVACVAEFTIPPPLHAIDLRDPRKLVSPFLLADATAVGQLRADIPFLDRLGSELTRPVQPQGAAIDYIPSQYLCEFIKKCSFDGVVYRSSVSAGINLALFDPAKAIPVAVKRYDVSRVSVEVAPA
jgi:hypothetical protein